MYVTTVVKRSNKIGLSQTSTHPFVMIRFTSTTLNTRSSTCTILLYCIVDMYALLGKLPNEQHTLQNNNSVITSSFTIKAQWWVGRSEIFCSNTARRTGCQQKKLYKVTPRFYNNTYRATTYMQKTQMGLKKGCLPVDRASL